MRVVTWTNDNARGSQPAQALWSRAHTGRFLSPTTNFVVANRVGINPRLHAKRMKRTDPLWEKLRVFTNLGCTRDEFRAYIEAQWLPGMTWDNYGRGGIGFWHIDHIRPKWAFDFGDPEEWLACCHFSNLRPRWARENSADHWNRSACRTSAP